MSASQLSTKTCKQCGSENDLLVSNCRRCRSSLARTDLNSVPEEVLLNNCSYWINKLESFHDFTNWSIERFYSNLPLSSLFRSSSKPPLDQITANCETYIRSLSVRAGDSDLLVEHIREFQKRLSHSRKVISEHPRTERKFTLVAISAPVVLFVVLFVLSDIAGSESRIERKRLEELTKQCEEAIRQRDLISAKLYASRLIWNESGEQYKAFWREQRESFLKCIASMDNSPDLTMPPVNLSSLEANPRITETKRHFSVPLSAPPPPPTRNLQNSHEREIQDPGMEAKLNLAFTKAMSKLHPNQRAILQHAQELWSKQRDDVIAKNPIEAPAISLGMTIKRIRELEEAGN